MSHPESFFTPYSASYTTNGGQLILSKPISTWPGITPESTRALEEALRKNYEKYHVFFNADVGFHNHLTHQVICSWALGAKPETIEEVYESNAKIQIPLVVSPEPITEKNFAAHAGDANFYQAYRDFFKSEVDKHGVAATIEEWMVGLSGNTNRGKAGKNPQMLARLLALLMHGFIHLGYGLEFGLPVMVIEGLASAAIHKADVATLMPESLFTSSLAEPGVFSSLFSLVYSSLSIFLPATANYSSTEDVHTLTIVGRMLRDSRFSESRALPDFDAIYATLNRGGEVIPYLDMWQFDASDLNVVQRKIAELHWTTTLLYASGRKGGKKENDPFWADFVTAHFLTSSTFLTSFVHVLSPKSRYILLSRYFGTILMWWWTRGCPILDIKMFQSRKEHTSDETPTEWFTLVEKSRTHLDEHLAKVIRSLSQLSQLYGSTSSHSKVFEDVELEGVEYLDGNFFRRVAVLTLKRCLEGNNDDGTFGFAPGAHWHWDRADLVTVV